MSENETRVSSDEARTSANVYIVLNIGDRMAAGKPVLKKAAETALWIVPLLVSQVKGDNGVEISAEIGESILVDADTGTIVNPPTREIVHECVRAVLSSRNSD